MSSFPFSHLVDDGRSEVHHKILLLGSNAVGKTSLVRRFVCDAFHDEYNPTLGADIIQTSFMTTDKTLQIYFWDTSGDPSFSSIIKSNIKESKTILIVYDLSKPALDQAVWWLNQINDFSTDENSVWLIRNKIDVENELTINDPFVNKSFQVNKKMYEVSAKTGQGTKTLLMIL
ncbi:Small GTP-binding protein RAB6 [Entamoeba marina]